ncbi:MAG: hypothetical protein ABH829_03855 [archaeon]
MKYALPLLVVLVLGCLTGGGSVIQKATAIEIVSFTPSLPQVTENDRVDLSLIVQNSGAFRAENVQADLFLHGNFKPYPGTGTTYISDKVSIRGPNIELKSQGETHEFVWKLQAPDIVEGEMQYPFTFSTDISYDYTSSAWKEFPILKQSRVNELRASSQQLPSSKSGVQPAPLMMDIKVYEPVVYSADTNTVTLTVLLEKVDQGFVQMGADPSIGSECGKSRTHCVDSVTLVIPSELTFPTAAEIASDPTLCDFTGTDATRRSKANVNLIDGTYAQLKCTLKMKPLATDEVFPLVKVDAAYTYHVRGSTSVLVVSR